MADHARLGVCREIAVARSEQASAGLDAAQLREVVLRISRRLRRHDLRGLTPSQLSVLSTLDRSGPLRLGDLAMAERLSPSKLTPVVSVLEAMGYVWRGVDAADARVRVAAVTDRGRDVFERVGERVATLLADVLAMLSAEQVEALDAALPALEKLAGSARFVPRGRSPPAASR